MRAHGELSVLRILIFKLHFLPLLTDLLLLFTVYLGGRFNRLRTLNNRKKEAEERQTSVRLFVSYSLCYG